MAKDLKNVSESWCNGFLISDEEKNSCFPLLFLSTKKRDQIFISAKTQEAWNGNLWNFFLLFSITLNDFLFSIFTGILQKSPDWLLFLLFILFFIFLFFLKSGNRFGPFQNTQRLSTLSPFEGKYPLNEQGIADDFKGDKKKNLKMSHKFDSHPENRVSDLTMVYIRSRRVENTVPGESF